MIFKNTVDVRLRNTGRKQEPVDYRRIGLSPGIAMRLAVECSALIAAADLLFYRRWLAVLFLMPLGVLWACVRLDNFKKKRQVKLREDFREMLDVMGTALRAGYSAERAFEEAEAMLGDSKGDCDMTRELHAINEGIRLNMPAEALLGDFALRSDSEDILNFSEVFTAAKRRGGPLADIMAQAAGTIGSKIDTEREIELALAGKAYEQKIVVLMIPAFILYMQLASPGFLTVLYTTPFGAVFMTGCLAAYGAAAYWSYRIMCIDV